MATIFAVCWSRVGWHDPQAVAYSDRQPGCSHRHKTPVAAARCDRRLQPPEDSGVMISTAILAEVDGRYWRHLTDAEFAEVQRAFPDW